MDVPDYIGILQWTGFWKKKKKKKKKTRASVEKSTQARATKKSELINPHIINKLLKTESLDDEILEHRLS